MNTLFLSKTLAFAMKNIRFLFIFSLISVLFLSACNSDDSSGNSTDDTSENTENKQPLGESAEDLLANIVFDRLEVEFVSINGFEPRAETVSNLQKFLEERLNKPGGIVINSRSIDPIGDAPYSTDEIRDIEDAVRTTFNDGSTISVFVLWVDGANVNDTQFSKTLGTAYRNTSVVLYEPTIREFSNDTGEPGRVALESTTLIHEVCHILGLVNLGTPLTSDHEDPLNNKHCIVEDCLMYFRTEVQGLDMKVKMKNLMEVTPLDPLCIADLQANGGK